MPAVAKLKWSDELQSAANNHSADMAQNETLSHTGSDRSSVGKRVSREGYRWYAVAENIAHGQRSVSEVMSAWLKSEGHCQNLMGEAYTHMGAGRSGTYWTQVFAAGE